MRGAREEFQKAANHYIQKATESEDSVNFILKVMHDANFVSGDVECLVSATLNYVDNHTPYFVMSKSFVDLTVDLLVLILQRDTLHQSLSELQLYLSVLRWGRQRGNLDTSDASQFDTVEIR